MKKQTCKSIDHRCDVQSSLRDCSNKQQYHSNCFSLQFYSFLPSTMVSMYLQTTASPEEELLQIYVRARAITCPIFQRFVCLCEIVSTNCQPSCLPKHSHMHSHASHMFMHLIKIVTLFIRICILNSYVNFNQNQSCQIQISFANNKCPLSCQFPGSTVLSTFLSNSSSCSYVNQNQFFFSNTICFC